MLLSEITLELTRQEREAFAQFARFRAAAHFQKTKSPKDAERQQAEKLHERWQELAEAFR